MLWRQVRRSLFRLAQAGGLVVTGALLLATGASVTVHLAQFVVAPAAAITVGAMLASLGRIAWLRRHPWTVYRYEYLRLYRDPITMTLVGRDQRRHPIRIRGSRNTAYLIGMVHPEVWFLGDPDKRGLLTVAGGGELLRTRRTYGR